VSKRIVLVTAGSLGDLHPYLAMGLELARRGHEAVVATVPFYRSRIESLGLRFHPVRPDLSPEDPELLRLAVDLKHGSENIFRKLVVPHLRTHVEDLSKAAEGADLLVSHPITLAAPVVAEKLSLRWASGATAPLVFLSAREPLEFAGHPVISALGRGLPFLRRAIRAGGRWLTASWVRPVAELRAELGLPPGGHPLFEGQHSPHLALALFSRRLAAPRPDWPASTVVTGFPWFDRKEGREELSPGLARFLDAGSPPIVFTLGSAAVHTAGDFFDESLAAARALGKRSVLLAGPNRLKDPGPDACCVDYAPHSQVLPLAEAIVHPGGVGTLGQAMRAGKPMLVVPTSNDQPDNAARVRRLGIARVLSRTKYRRDRVERELLLLLRDPACSAKAAEVGREVASEDGARAAADAIERLTGR
jgi:UDP:flavonoid glycosyltransferase YjiC (YdhE family)